MTTAQSTSAVQRIRQEDNKFLVSFSMHSGYFKVPESPLMPEMKERLLKAQKNNEEITFTFDKDLNILKVL